MDSAHELRWLDLPQWKASITDGGVVRCCSTCVHLDRPRAYPAECCPYREHDANDTAYMTPCRGWVEKEET